MNATRKDVGTKTEPVRIMGALDKGKDDIDRLCAKSKSDIVLDFSTCTFVSVDGLEWLEELVIRADSSGINVLFENIPPPVYKAFKVSHIDGILRACGAPSSKIGPVC
ncbi:MAG: STAS domain-containing protein [Candidatus Obscuribacterales bacterium]|nr:STAS domain-containing protein [Candidatus Obscuribacterales bacterium]